MKFRGIVAGALAFALSASLAFAQVNQGTSPLTGPKGGTNNAFMQFTGPATSIKTFTLPNASDTIATLAAIQTFSAAKTFNNATLLLAGLSSGTTTLIATAAASGTLTLPATTDTLVGKATTDTLTNKTISGGSNTLSSIANSSLSNMAAYTLKGNATGSAAAPSDVDVTALTLKASPVSADIVLIQDSAASNAFKRTTVGALATAGSVASFNGRTGAVVPASGDYTIAQITNAPFTKSFTSTAQTVSAAGSLAVAHGLGATPSLVQVRLKCTTADLNYAIGDEVVLSSFANATTNRGIAIWPDATNVNVRFGSDASPIEVTNKTTGGSSGITAANWNLIIRAWL